MTSCMRHGNRSEYGWCHCGVLVDCLTGTPYDFYSSIRHDLECHDSVSLASCLCSVTSPRSFRRQSRQQTMTWLHAYAPFPFPAYLADTSAKHRKSSELPRLRSHTFRPSADASLPLVIYRLSRFLFQPHVISA